ncbi:hypothetical protein ACVWZK_008541 [Bradyrhizobium sp. GM0.4]
MAFIDSVLPVVDRGIATFKGMTLLLRTKPASLTYRVAPGLNL